MCTPNFYAKCEPQPGGTRIEGYFAIGPFERGSLRIALIMVLAVAVVGIVLNLLDLMVGTHFTKDPDIGLPLSVLFIPFCFGIHRFAHRLGSGTDEGVLAFLESTLAARRIS
ncbi:MAG TPA: hypothetical protein VFE61_27460 [Candidatus Sulfotelmatobacter sp.]|nr:hypothetical protein [Candidatus Sulfotelmatobacter sp.]